MIFETSWDDGHILDLKLVELLTKYKLPGTFYVTCEKVGTVGYLSWGDIKFMRGNGFNIGSHTMSHPPDLKTLYGKDLEYEIGQSKATLESVLNETVQSFCYPRGRYDNRVLEYVADAGYTEARTTEVLKLHLGDPFKKPTTIHVYQRTEYDDLSWFDIAKLMFDKAVEFNIYFHIWGHSAEIEKYNNWDKLEAFFKYVKNSPAK